jgi:hypothetical protein
MPRAVFAFKDVEPPTVIRAALDVSI